MKQAREQVVKLLTTEWLVFDEDDRNGQLCFFILLEWGLMGFIFP